MDALKNAASLDLFHSLKGITTNYNYLELGPKAPLIDTITFSFCFRLTQTFTIETLFNLDTVQTGETMACFVPLKQIAVMPVRACPLASLRASFYDYFDDKEHEIMNNKVMKWHQDFSVPFLIK